MTKLQQALVTMNSFSLGIILPVLNLVLLERGASLQTLPILMAIYAVTVLALELPSGVCADLYGRKTVFLISCGFQIISLILLIFSNNIVLLVFVVIFNGLSRAFSSGSLDALIIDQTLALYGDSCLAKVTSRLAILEGSGLAAGGIAGGFISYLYGSYFSNLILRIFFTAVIFILCFIYMKESVVLAEREETISLFIHLKKGWEIIVSAPLLRYIFAGVFFVGFFLITIETYWQPAFINLSSASDRTWVLGIITFLGFLAAAAGNSISQKILDKFSNYHWCIYNIFRFILAIGILIFAVQQSSIGFILGYAGIYFMLGAGNVSENTLVNQVTPSHMRASLLSLISFITQLGVMCASVFSSIMIKRLHFTGLWMITGLLLGGYVLITASVTYLKRGLLFGKVVKELQQDNSCEIEDSLQPGNELAHHMVKMPGEIEDKDELTEKARADYEYKV
ncbi:MFS transporter [Anaerocolumna sp. MB42-C2]|uniref:MFS transporter n=1 Tax=Anaerocolumna sp. MB42-C2 TaxID=3070997 RepID=UPI0027E126D9|nr:MFS transporter [Anaerocolumna sp. MB42-C2]WMJ89310.1 MFS transporter [Anaerocolumna sp. MB42-C2]